MQEVERLYKTAECMAIQLSHLLKITWLQWKRLVYLWVETFFCCDIISHFIFYLLYCFWKNYKRRIKYLLVTPTPPDSLFLVSFVTGNFLMSVAGGVSQFLLKWFVGFRTSVCKMESFTIEKMQTLQVAFSFTFRICLLLLHPALLMPVEVLPWISNLIGPEILSSFGQLFMTFHRVCRCCSGGWALCHTWWELCSEVLTVLSLDVVQSLGVISKSQE